MRLKCAVATLP